MNKTFDTLSAESTFITFNSEWDKHTGYHDFYDFAVKGEHAPILSFGEVVTTIDPMNRRLVIIGTSTEKRINMVLFDRYNDRNGLIVCNWDTNAYLSLTYSHGISFMSVVSEKNLKKFCEIMADSSEFKRDYGNPELKEVLKQFATT